MSLIRFEKTQISDYIFLNPQKTKFWMVPKGVLWSMVKFSVWINEFSKIATKLFLEYCLISIPLHFFGPFSEKVPMKITPFWLMDFSVISTYFLTSSGFVKK